MFRYLSWFTSSSGRFFTRCCVGGAALTVFGTTVATQGPLLGNLQEIVQLYDDKVPKPLAPRLNELIEEVLENSSLKEEEKKKVKFFYVAGHQPFHAGGIDSPWGAAVGLPFFFGGLENFTMSHLRVRGKDMLDLVIEGKDLFDSLKISDNAKRFVILREIHSCSLKDTLINATIAAGCVIIPARLAAIRNKLSNALEALTLGQRIRRYFIFYAMGFILYRLLKDPVKHLSDMNADRLAAEVGPDYLDGGIEFYQKTLQKNRALEELMSSRFFTMYDKQGNEYYILLPPKLPITKRLEILQKMKKEKTVNSKDE